MADQQEQTDLIDVSDMAAEFEEAASGAGGADEGDLFSAHDTAAAGPEAPILAPFKERFVALFVDGAILALCYCGLLWAYRLIAFSQPAGAPPLDPPHVFIFHGLFLLIALIYFLLGEGVFFATPGKLVCHVRVRKSSGEPPGFAAVLVRNLFRPLDLILIPVLIGTALLEKTERRQRLGDLIAGTMVMKLERRRKKNANEALGLASVSGRCLAFLIDTVFCAGVIAGLALLFTPGQLLTNEVVAVAAPFLLFLFLTLPETWAATSPGKWLCGFAIAHEDGSRPSFASATVRTLFRLIDTNPFGFLSLLLASRRQRFGDVAAGTLVVRSSRRWPGALAFFLALLIAGGLMAWGMSRPEHLIDISSAGFFAPQPTSPTVNLHVLSFRFAAGEPSANRESATFRPGETVYLIFEVSGFTVKADQAWLKEDLTIRYPDDSIGLKLQDVINFHETVGQAESVELMNNVALPATALPGRYTMTVTIHDIHSNRQLNEQHFFTVIAPPSPPPPFEQPAGGNVEERNVPAAASPPSAPETPVPPPSGNTGQ